MRGVIRVISLASTLALVALSLYSIISSGEVGYQSWIFLLLVPLAIALALSSKNEEISQKKLSGQWDEDEKNDDEGNLQAGDFGYDTPVL